MTHRSRRVLGLMVGLCALTALAWAGGKQETGASAEAAAAGMTAKESPMLAERVASGELPRWKSDFRKCRS